MVAGDRAQAGLATEGWLAGAGPGELAEVAADALPDGPDRFLLAGDLTVVAPGGLAPGVETRLAGLADREAAGSGTWRIHDASLRRAFDEGDRELKLYSIYAPPDHPPGTVHVTKDDAEHDEADDSKHDHHAPSADDD